MSLNKSLLAPGVLLAAGSFAAPADAASFEFTQTYNLTPASTDTQNVTIGDSGTPQYTYFVSGGSPTFRTLGTSGINKTRFTQSTQPTATEVYSIGGTEGYAKSVNPSLTEDSYYHLMFDIDGSRYLGEAFFDAAVDGTSPATLATISYDEAGAVPEPETWVELIAGLGATGAVLRSRRRRQASLVSA